jgi:hypothetical protein
MSYILKYEKYVRQFLYHTQLKLPIWERNKSFPPGPTNLLEDLDLSSAQLPIYPILEIPAFFKFLL